MNWESYSVAALIRAGIDPDAAHAIARSLYALADVDPRAAERHAQEIYARLKQGKANKARQRVLRRPVKELGGAA